MLYFTYLLLRLAVLATLLYLTFGSSAIGQELKARCLRITRGFLALVSVLAIGWYLLSASLYFIHDGYVNHVEPSIASHSYGWLLGQPPYHSPDAGERSSLPYGPWLFIVHALLFHLFGPSMLVSKLAGFLAALLSPLLFHALVRRFAPPATAWAATGLLTLYLLMYCQDPFGNKSDPLILTGVILASWSTLLTSAPAAFLVFALPAGFSMGLKLHAIIYYLPILACHSRHRSGKWLAGSLFTAGLVAAAPFLLRNDVSLPNFIWCLTFTANHGFDTSLFVQGLNMALFLLLLPLGVGSFDTADREDRHFGVLLFSLAAAVLVSSKAGAGPIHLLPFIPLTLALAAKGVPDPEALFRQEAAENRRTRLTVSLLAASFLVGTGFAAANQWYFWGIMADNMAAAPTAELRDILASHPGMPVSLGYGSRDPALYRSTDYRLSLWHPIVVLAGTPLAFDLPAVMDMTKAGLELPDASIDLLRSGRMKLWIIPRGAAPFLVFNIYEPHTDLFGERFRTAFHRYYRLATPTEHFDLWEYTAGNPGR
ncbi:MAG TPA: hypothetical protein VIV61_14585 [Candidatus Ozemobacteraceae bacterium]